MLAVAVDLLTGRYAASTYNDRMEAEWPPHPARLFSALVATWADADEPDPRERAVLAWLEGLGPPQLRCSDEAAVLRRAPVTVYVPVNDPAVVKPSPDAKAAALQQVREAFDAAASPTRSQEAALRKAEAGYRDAVRKAISPTPKAVLTELEVLPEHRNRQARWFPTVTPDDPTVRFLWPEAEPSDEQRAVLDGLLARVARFGHSASLVSLRLEDSPPAPTLVPRPEDGTIILRVPRTGSLARLEREFARHQGTRERLLPAAMAAYGPPVPRRPVPPSGTQAGDWIVLEVAAGPGVLVPRISRSLALARAVRERLLAHSEAVGFVGGLWGDGPPRAHLAVVPLPAAGYRWADGAVRAVALMLPREATPEDRAAVEAALRGWANAAATEAATTEAASTETGAGTGTGLAVALSTTAGQLPVRFHAPRWAPAVAASQPEWGDLPYSVRRDTWCRPSRQWLSVTPVALDRQVPGLGDARPHQRERAAARVRATVRDACRYTGLPEPAEVEFGFDGLATAVPQVGRFGFPGFVAAGSGDRRQVVHVQLTFAEPVAGPVLLGAGRYLGYGLFLPVHDGVGNRS